MHLTHLQTTGLGPAGPLSWEDLPRACPLGGTASQARHALDALDVFFGALSPAGLRRALWRLRVADTPDEIQVTGDPLPDQATWPWPDGARSLLEPDGDRTVRVAVDLTLDPLQFRRLREEAARDTDLLAALARADDTDAAAAAPRRAASVRLTIGWLFNRRFDAVTVGPVALAVAGAPISLGGTARPAWVGRFLQDLAGRYQRVPDLWHVAGTPPRPGAGMAAAWLDARTSADPARQRAQEALGRTLGEAPFLLPTTLPVRWNGAGAEVVTGAHLEPLRTRGARALAHVEAAAAVHLSGAEILGFSDASHLGDDVRAWLGHQALDDGSPLEQVFFADPGPTDETVDPAGAPIPEPTAR